MRKLLGNTAIFTISNFILQGLQFILLPLYSNLITPEDYGLIGTINTTAYLIGIVASLNIFSAIGKYYFECKSDDEVCDLYSKITKGTVYIASGSCTATIILGLILFRTFEWKGYEGFLLAIVAKYLLCYYNLFQSLYIAKQMAKTIATSTVMCSLVNLLGTYICVSNFENKILGYFIGTMLSAIVGFMFFIICTKKYLVNTSISGLRKYIKYSTAQIASSLSFWIINTSDRYVLSGIRGSRETGIYNMASNFGTVHNIIVMSYNNVYVPNTFNNLENNDGQIKQKELMYVYFIINIWSCSGLLVLAGDIVKYLNPSYWNCYEPAIILLAASFVTGIMQIYNGIVSFYVPILRKKNAIIVCGALINIILNFMLIPRHGAVGASVATLVANLLIMLGMIILGVSCKRVYILPYRETITTLIYIILAFLFDSNIFKILLSVFFTLALACGCLKTTKAISREG